MPVLKMKHSLALSCLAVSTSAFSPASVSHAKGTSLKVRKMNDAALVVNVVIGF